MSTKISIKNIKKIHKAILGSFNEYAQCAQDWNIERNISRELCIGRYLVGSDRGISGLKQDVVKGEGEALGAHTSEEFVFFHIQRRSCHSVYKIA